MTKETRALIEAAERAQLLLRGLTVGTVMERGIEAINAAGLNPYCMNEGRATGNERISTDWLEAAISSAKAAEEGVETDWRVECERGKWNETFLPDDLKDARLVYLEAVRDYPNAKKISLIRRDTYTTVIEVREKEGL